MKHPKTAPIPTPGGGGGDSTAIVVYPGPTNRYINLTPAAPWEQQPPTPILNTISHLGQTLENTTRKAETVIGNLYNHLKISPSVAGAAMSRLAHGTKVLAEGGHDKVFRQTFGILPAEELKKAYACYLSTSSGPIAGTLYITTHRIAFCSENPLCRCTDSYLPAAPGTAWKQNNVEWVYYKVVVMVHDLMAVDGAANQLNPLDKYIRVVTRDANEFWFMGFISYDKALNNLRSSYNYNYKF
ncbi:hypothetical protein Dimus_019797 [Dionaea muscipula]